MQILVFDYRFFNLSWLWRGANYTQISDATALVISSSRIKARHSAPMSAPLTRTSAFAEVQDGDGAGGAGPTLERVELILAKWKYIYIYTCISKHGTSFSNGMSQNCCWIGVASCASWCFCGTNQAYQILGTPLTSSLAPEGESVSRVKRKCFTIAEIAHHFCVSQFAVFEKNSLSSCSSRFGCNQKDPSTKWQPVPRLECSQKNMQFIVRWDLLWGKPRGAGFCWNICCNYCGAPEFHWHELNFGYQFFAPGHVRTFGVSTATKWTTWGVGWKRPIQ